MIFKFSDEQEAIREVARDFATKELAPHDAEWDENKICDRSVLKKMGELGFTGMLAGEEYDGYNLGRLTTALVFEELSKGSFSVVGPLTVHNLIGSLICAYGNEDQRQNFVKPLARGEKLGALSLSEEGAGSDAKALKTKAVVDGDFYVINGRKIFCTSGGEAEIYVVIVRTEDSFDDRKYSAIIVEKGTPGLSFGPPEKKMGYSAYPTTDVIFEDCKVPRENLLGHEGEGFKIVMAALNGGRVNIGAISVGLAQAALDYAINYAKERVQFGKPIATFQGLQFKMAELATEIEAARLLVYQAAYRMDQNLPHISHSAMCKLFATDVAMKVTTEAVQMLGGYGYMRDYPVERYMRYAKISQIVEGTNEIQKVIISRLLLED